MMNKKKIFIAIDTNKVSKAKKIIRDTQTNKIKIGYKFGLEFMNSKNGRRFISTLRNKIIFVDLKLKDTVNTMVSAVKALKDLKIDYLTVHISSGLAALKAVKKVSGRTRPRGPWEKPWQQLASTRPSLSSSRSSPGTCRTRWNRSGRRWPRG